MILIPKYKDAIQIHGALSFVLTDTTSGNIRQELYVPNLVVTAGKSFIASRMVGESSAIMSHMAIGTGLTGELATNTDLAAELNPATYTNYSRASLSVKSATNNVVTYSANFPANNPSAPSATGAILREAGIFNSPNLGQGTMLCRTTFPTVTKLPADALTITWTITIQ